MNLDQGCAVALLVRSSQACLSRVAISRTKCSTIDNARIFYAVTSYYVISIDIENIPLYCSGLPFAFGCLKFYSPALLFMRINSCPGAFTCIVSVEFSQYILHSCECRLHMNTILTDSTISHDTYNPPEVTVFQKPTVSSSSTIPRLPREHALYITSPKQVAGRTCYFTTSTSQDTDLSNEVLLHASITTPLQPSSSLDAPRPRLIRWFSRCR